MTEQELDHYFSKLQAQYPGWKIIHGGVRKRQGRGLETSVMFLRREPLEPKPYTSVRIVIEATPQDGVLHRYGQEPIWCAVYPGSFNSWLDAAVKQFTDTISKEGDTHGEVQTD